MNLAAEAFSRERGVWRSCADMQRAHDQLMLAGSADAVVKQVIRDPSGEFKLLKTWFEELVPVWRYALNNNLPVSTFSLAADSLPAVDLILRDDETETAIEVTIAQADWAAEKVEPKFRSPGYQDALRFERMAQDGFVSNSTPLARDEFTNKVIYAEEEIAKPVEANIEAWARGITVSMTRKFRGAEYGGGSTLIVYAEGMSRDFITINESVDISAVVSRVKVDTSACGFGKVFIVSWHAGSR